MDRVGALCSSVGGVCGWSCGATIATREALRTKNGDGLVMDGETWGEIGLNDWCFFFFFKGIFEGWIYRYHGYWFHDLWMESLRFKFNKFDTFLKFWDSQIWTSTGMTWSLGDSELCLDSFPNCSGKPTLNSNFAGLSRTLGCGI